jgi:hypothetical protein
VIFGTIKNPVHDPTMEMLPSKSARVELIEPSNSNGFANTQAVQDTIRNLQLMKRKDEFHRTQLRTPGATLALFANWPEA